MGLLRHELQLSKAHTVASIFVVSKRWWNVLILRIITYAVLISPLIPIAAMNKHDAALFSRSGAITSITEENYTQITSSSKDEDY